MRFQALCWEVQEKDVLEHAIAADSKGWKRLKTASVYSAKEEFESSTCVVHITGRTDDGKTVRVALVDARPTFYARTSQTRFDTIVQHAKMGFPPYEKSFRPWWVQCSAMVCKRVYQGFQHGKLDDLLEIVAAHPKCMRAMKDALKEADVEVFNSKMDLVCSIFHQTGVRPCGWIDISDDAFGVEDGGDGIFRYARSFCDVDFVAFKRHLRPHESIAMAPFRIMSIDIEAFAPLGLDGLYPFPDGSKLSNEISCICVRMRTLTSADCTYACFTYRQIDVPTMRRICDEEKLQWDEGVSSICSSEREMLLSFLSFFRDVAQPDIITGWNTLNFDMKYIFQRCQIHGMVQGQRVCLESIGKFEQYKPRLQKKTLSTAGAGDNSFEFWHIAGVLHVDEMVIVKRDMKQESYTLNAIAGSVLGDHKLDEPPHEIHRKSQGSPVELAEIVAYCAKDTALPDAIACKLQSYLRLVMFANMAMVPADYIILRGANIKTTSLIANKVCAKYGMVISEKKKKFNFVEGKYEGATVLEAKRQICKVPVATLDFKSLYPSIVISQCLDPHCFVEDPQYLNMEGVCYKEFRWNDEKMGKQHCFHIVTNGHELGCPPVIPEIMRELWSERDRAKKRMKTAADAFEKSVHDAVQLAIKVLMNSIYGFFGAVATNELAHLPIAMIITKTGRDMIHETQRFILARYGRFNDDSTLDERLRLSKEELEQRNHGLENVYGDTDSVFVKWELPSDVQDKDDQHVLEWTFAHSENAAAEITTFLNDTMCVVKGVVELEFEKVFHWFILYAKKRYAGLKFTNINAHDYVDCKGIQVVRRDNNLFTRNLLKIALDIVLIEHDIAKCTQFIEDQLCRLTSNNVPLDELSKSAKLKPGGYAGTAPPHYAVAQRMRQRGLPVPYRVPYVIVVARGNKLNERAEDPAYVMANPDIRVDIVYYLTNLSVPLIDVLSPAVPDLDDIIQHHMRKAKKQQRPYERIVEQNSMRMRSIASFFFTPLRNNVPENDQE